jgi:nucleotide-binding universal stress UspA family protein
VAGFVNTIYFSKHSGRDYRWPKEQKDLNPHVELELFGVNRSFRYQTIKKQLVHALEQSGVDYTLSDIGDIDKFIEIGLDSVPAIRVDHEKLFSMRDPENAHKAVESVYDFIVDQKMNSLLVPVDFSDCADNALKYAVALAPHLGLKLDLLHVYHPVVDPHNAVILDSDLGTTMCKRLEDLGQSYRDCEGENEFDRPVSTRFEIGFPLQVIEDVSKEESISLIVMGTLGAANVVDQVLGSNSSSAAHKSRKPIILIPPDVTFSPPKHIVVAFSDELVNSEAIHKLFAFNNPFGAHIDFVHVQEDNYQEFGEIRDKLMRRVFENGTPSFSFDVHAIAKSEKNIAASLQTYADEHKPDLLVVTSKRRGMISRLFHASVSRHICLNPHGPVLVLHND